MFILIIVLVIIAAIFLSWLKPFLEYKKIGSYCEYKPISKKLNDKELEYSWYQINGFKNIEQEAIEYFREISRSVKKTDLKWLYECKSFLEEGLVKAEETDATRFSVSNLEQAGLFEILRVIKRSRKSLLPHYQKIGCSTCGEAFVMHVWISLRIQQIEKGEAINPGDLDYVVDAVKELRQR